MLSKLNAINQKLWIDVMRLYEDVTLGNTEDKELDTKPKVIKEYKEFYRAVQDFKLNGRIKSIRREVFGASTNPETMGKILLNKAEFLNTTSSINVIKFLTRKELIDEGKVKFPEVPESYDKDIEIKKAQKYEKIALLRISIDDIKNKNKWRGNYLYSEGMHDTRDTYELVQLTKMYHTIPCFADIHIYDRPQLFGEVFSALAFSNSISYPLLGFQRCNDISEHYKLIEGYLINDQLSHGNIVYEGMVIGSKGLRESLLKKYDINIKYVLFLYGHPTGSASAEWHHISVIIGELRNGIICKVINLDGYDQIAMKEVGEKCGVPFIRIVVGGMRREDRYKQDLQPASWQNMNCMIYAIDLLKLFAYAYTEYPLKVEKAISNLRISYELKARYLPGNELPKSALEEFIYLITAVSKGEKLAELYGPLFDKEGYINMDYPTTYCDKIRLKLAQRYLEDWTKNNTSYVREEFKIENEEDSRSNTDEHNDKNESAVSSNNRKYLRRSISLGVINEQGERQDNFRYG